MRGNSICSLKDRVLPAPLIRMGGPRAAAGTVLVKTEMEQLGELQSEPYLLL